MSHSPDIGKIALIDASYSPSPFVSQLADSLRARHPATRIVLMALAADCPMTSGCLPSKLELVPDDPRSPTNLTHVLNQAAREIDVVSLHFHHPFRGGQDYEFLNRFVGDLTIPVLLTIHDIPSHISRRFASNLMGIVARSDRIVVANEGNKRSVVEALGVPKDRVGLIPLPGSGIAIRDRVAYRMDDPFPSPPTKSPSSESTASWDDVAEAYNHNLVKAIINALPGKQSTRIDAWPWARSCEFNMSAGCAPGWDH